MVPFTARYTICVRLKSNTCFISHLKNHAAFCFWLIFLQYSQTNNWKVYTPWNVGVRVLFWYKNSQIIIVINDLFLHVRGIVMNIITIIWLSAQTNLSPVIDTTLALIITCYQRLYTRPELLTYWPTADTNFIKISCSSTRWCHAGNINPPVASMDALRLVNCG